MDTVIQTQGFKLTPSLDSFIRSQIKSGLRCSADKIERVIVRLRDANGPSGADDKQCSVEIKLSRRPIIIISRATGDMYQSVRQTTKKAARTALRKIKRRRTLRLKDHLKAVKK